MSVSVLNQLELLLDTYGTGSDPVHALQELKESNRRLRVAVEELRSALETADGEHLFQCAKVDHNAECDCGLETRTAALVKAKEAT